MVLLAGLLIAALCAPAHAWEFAMTGNYEWDYFYHSQGPNGFFGAQGVLNPALAGTALNWWGANFWAGARLLSGDQLGLVTGLDANAQFMRQTFNPEIRVNPAVRLRGQYIIGSWQQYSGGPAAFGGNLAHASSFYLNQQTGSAITRPIDTGFWNLWWATAQTPWGILVIGKRPFAFGTGSMADGEHTVCSESLAIVAPYGPLRIGVFAYPWRQNVFIDSQRNLTGAGVNQLGQIATNTSGGGGPKLWDTSGVRLQLPQMGAFVTYSNGPLDAGISYEHFQNHNGPGMSAANQSIAAIGVPTIDASIEDGLLFAKYNNGRFFFNGQLAWWRWMNRFQPPPIGQRTASALTALGLGDPYQPTNTEGWEFDTEFGLLCGPSKVSFLYAFFPGPDRRNGIWISRSDWNNIALGHVPGNWALFLPYSYLMGYTYGSGLQFVNGRGEGGFTDATVVASRLDYAVAANLNFSASFIWAWRNSGAWPWGTLSITGGNAAANAALPFGLPNLAPVVGIPFAGLGVGPQNAGAVRAPNIPDNNLGWEVTTGVDWKLLEGLTMNLRGAYWQPGEWFKFACVDKALVTTVVGTTLVPALGDGAAIGSAWAVNPAKTIDPIWAFTGALNVDF